MGSKWETVRLGDSCIKIGSGATPKGGNSVYTDTGNTYFIRSQNIYNDGFNINGLVFITDEAAFKLKNVDVQENDVLLNITGDSVARVCIAPRAFLPARVNQHVAIIRPKKDVFSPRFLRYFLSSPYQQTLLLTLASAGATRNALTKGMIEDLQVPKPPVHVQLSIANVLERFDKKIESNNKINQTLEQMSQTLFKSWFVNFDPVIDNALDAGNPIPEALQSRAELRQKVRNSADFNPLPADIRALFPAEFEKTELGWVPKGWILSDLGKEFNITMGQSPSGSTYNEDGIGLPFFQGKTDFGFRFPSKRIYCTEPKRLAKKFDTLLSVRAPVGVVNLASTECIIGRGLAALRHKSGNIAFTYYSVSNLSDYFSIFNGEGTVFGSINQKDLKQLPQICPPEKLINKFEEFSGKWETMVSVHCSEIESLSNLRDTLLPKLISGELSLEDLPDLVDQTEPA